MDELETQEEVVSGGYQRDSVNIVIQDRGTKNEHTLTTASCSRLTNVCAFPTLTKY